MSAPGGFEVDPSSLRASAGELAALAERARAVANELAEALQAVPRPWGGDVVGESFAATHVEAADHALRQVNGVAGAFEEFGTALAEAATAYLTADADAASAVNATDEPDRAG
ncbi:type VII secretion target [Saccharomonospora xinjiangensis]|uniref:PE domain-containing protein n=1 Tax=Saccharomonospora xinjiangensis TaxID=75294 RepID=UPI00350E98CE